MPRSDWLTIAGVTALLAACVPRPVPMDFSRAELMPEPAAKSIIAKIVPGYAGGNDLALGGRSQPIKSLQNLRLYRDGKLTIEGTSQTFAICDVSVDVARQLAEAFTALGGSIRLDQTDDINPWVGCSLTLGR